MVKYTVFTILTIFKCTVQWPKHVHIAVRPLPPSIFRTLPSSLTETVPIKHSLPIPPPHQPLETNLLFSVYEFDCSRYLTEVDSYKIFSFLSRLFLLASRLQSSSVLWHISECPSFLQLNNILLCVYAALCLCIHSSVDIWVVSPFWLLWMMLLWTWVYEYLLETLLSILLGRYPEVEFLGHAVILCLIFWGPTIWFSTAAAPFCIPNPLSSYDFLILSIPRPQ